MKKLLISLALISLSSITNAGVYQCKVNGSLTYQDKPCAGSTEQSSQIKEKQNAYKNAQEKREREKAEWNAKSEPKIGMTMTQVEKTTWGYPDKVNKTTTSNSSSEQWVYRRGKSSKYLYFTNGILKTIQDF